MYRSVGKCWLLLGIVVVFVMAAACPAQAGWWTKYYRFVNQTGSDQHYARAILQGLEVVTGFYSGPDPWGGGSSSLIWLAGVPSTAVTSPPQATNGGLIPDGMAVMMGWHCVDASCRLRDLRWLDANGVASGPVLPTHTWGVPGGGFIIQTGTDTFEWWMCNDTGLPIQVSQAEFMTFSADLSWEDLGDVATYGFTGRQVETIDLLFIDPLYAEVEAAGSGVIPAPAARSLLRKLDNAAADKDAGLVSYQVDDVDRALWYWGKAIGHMESFKSQITNMDQKKQNGDIPELLAGAWITAAEEIMSLLRDLPVPPLEGVPPVLLPGECFSFEISGGEANALVLHGTIFDDNGNPVLDWVEQTETVDVPTCAILITDPEPAYLWPADHKMVDMTAELASKFEVYSPSDEATWYFEEVVSNQPEDDTGDGDTEADWIIDGQWLVLRAERSGNDEARIYTVTVRAVGDNGVPSEPMYLRVFVDHDQGE